MGSGEQGVTSNKSGGESGFAGELSKCLLYNGMLKKPRVPEVKNGFCIRGFLQFTDTTQPVFVVISSIY